MNRGTFKADASRIVAKIPESAIPAAIKASRELRAAFIRGAVDGALAELEECQAPASEAAETEHRYYLIGYSYGCDHEKELRP